MGKEKSEEIEKIKEAVNYYIDGAKKQDYELIYKGWHSEAKMMALNDDTTLKIYDRSIWEEWYKNAKEDPNVTRTSEILSIDFHGIAGNAKVKTIIENPDGTIIYIDYLNLLKIEDKWQIANKIFNTERIPKN
ncbi:MAG TPA: nuclear transport factor 2 family protein [candidate division Zixibacteria bacterium]|nr:nuclear transport factor 2 family protein [candidate division Zixibacteria bacterium]